MEYTWFNSFFIYFNNGKLYFCSSICYEKNYISNVQILNQYDKRRNSLLKTAKTSYKNWEIRTIFRKNFIYYKKDVKYKM